MALRSSENARKPLSTSGSNVILDNTHGDTKVTSKRRKAQPSLNKYPSLLRDSFNLFTIETSAGTPVPPQETTLALDPLPGKRGPNFAALLAPKDLSWSSSTVKTCDRFSSATSSPGAWDFPETPPRLSDTPSPGQTRTPLTPLTPPSPSLGRRNSSKLAVKELPDSYFDDVIGSTAVNSPTPVKDAYPPRKLFRNYTLELEKISESNATAGQLKYSKEPSFVFSLDEAQPISSRTRSKTNKVIPLSESKSPTQASDAPRIVAEALVSSSKLPSFLELIIPLDLYKRLGAVSSGCIGSVTSRSYAQCGKRPGGSLHDALAIAGNFARYRVKKDYDAMIHDIERLVRSSMCGTHKNVVLNEIKGGSRIENLRDYLFGSKFMSKMDQRALDQWLDAITSPNTSRDHIPWVRRAFEPTVLATPRPVACKPPINTSKSLSTDPNVSKPNGQICSFADFTPFQLNRTKGLSVSDALLMEIQRPITANEINPGFIYMFWDKRYFGKLKIGRTNNIERRLKEWNRKCGKTHSYLSKDDRSCIDMPHVGRVERLIHTELKECREKRKCEGCGTSHREWFGEDEVHAVKVVRKWQEWMMQQPYVKNATGQWELRPEMLESLGQVCEPLARDKVVVKQPRKSEGAKRTLRKKSGRKTI